MNGWIEPQQQTETRAARIKLRDAEYRLTQAAGPEKAQEVLKGVPYDVPIQQVAEAVKLIADLAEAQALKRRLAQLADTSDLGARVTISGGEVLELDPNRPLEDDEFTSWDDDPGYF